MATLTDHVDTIIESATAYGKTSYELIKLQAVNEVSDHISSAIRRLVVFTALWGFVLFLSTGIALLLGDLLGKIYYGFLIVAGVYLIAVIALRTALKGWLEKIISNVVIREVLH